MKNEGRDFIKFLGASGYALSGLSLFQGLSSCSSAPIQGALPSFKDELILKNIFQKLQNTISEELKQK